MSIERSSACTEEPRRSVDCLHGWTGCAPKASRPVRSGPMAAWCAMRSSHWWRLAEPDTSLTLKLTFSASTNLGAATGSGLSPWQRRPRPFLGSHAPLPGFGSPSEGVEVPPAQTWSNRLVVPSGHLSQMPYKSVKVPASSSTVPLTYRTTHPAAAKCTIGRTVAATLKRPFNQPTAATAMPEPTRAVLNCGSEASYHVFVTW